MNTIEIDESDLRKLEAAIHEAYMFHLHRDEMNARVHLAKKMIESPLTSMLRRAWERCRVALGDGDAVAIIPESV